MKTKLILFITTLCFLITLKSSAQSPKYTIDITLGELINPAAPDSLFKAGAELKLGDSLNVRSVHFLVYVSADSVPVLDRHFIVPSLPTSDNQGIWKDGKIIHIPTPHYNPLAGTRYVAELLDENGVLLMQIEKNL